MSVTNGNIAWLSGGLSSGSREGFGALGQGLSWQVQAHTLHSLRGNVGSLCGSPRESLPWRSGPVKRDLAPPSQITLPLDNKLTHANSFETRILFFALAAWGSVDWAPAWEQKGCQFDSQWRHMPKLWARSPVGGTQEATTHWCFPLFLPSFPSAWKSINKILKEKQTRICQDN